MRKSWLHYLKGFLRIVTGRDRVYISIGNNQNGGQTSLSDPS
jgi:hypothetical protein